MTLVEREVSRPPLRYHGAKFGFYRKLAQHVNMPHLHYAEPFCGGASVLLSKPRSKIETINDINGDVVNFFSVLRDRTDELVRMIDLTPFSREEYKNCADFSTGSDLERARKFYAVSWQGRAAGGSKKLGGWRWVNRGEGRRPPAVDWCLTDYLYEVAQRLSGVQIESIDAIDFIERHASGTSLLYVDPPYDAHARGNGVSDLKEYEFDLGDEQQIALADALHSAPGKIVLSGYDSPLYDKLYGDWQKIQYRWLKDSGGKGEGSNEATECVWLNPAAEAPASVDLFSGLQTA